MEKEKPFYMSGASDARIDHSDDCNALDAHYLRAKKQMEHDKRALELMGRKDGQKKGYHKDH